MENRNKKILRAFVVAGFLGVMALTDNTFAQQTETAEESNSQKWENEKSQEILAEYESQYQRNLEVATKEIEEKLYGIWQVKENVGWTSSDRISYDGGIGEIYIFCEETWIRWQEPCFKPVYYYCRTDQEELSSKNFLNTSWTDDRYEDQEAIYILATYSEVNKADVAGDKYWKPQLQLIFFGDTLVVENSRSYFEMEKIADIQMNDKFVNVERPDK